MKIQKHLIPGLRAKRALGFQQKVLAAEYGVGPSNISILTSKKKRPTHGTCSICGEHVEYYLGTRRCHECSKEYSRNQHRKHSAKRLEEKKEYYKENVDRIKEYKSREDVKARNAEGKKEAYAANPEKYKAQVADYHQRNPHVCKAANQRRYALKKSTDDGTLSSAVIKQLLDDATDCPYCGKSMKTKSVDHLVPLALGGKHSIHNVLVCCKSCNSKKNDKDLNEWIESLPADRKYEDIECF